MRRSLHALHALTVLLAVSGCATLVPATPEPAPAIPSEWPLPADTPAAPAAPLAPADIGWRDFFADPALQALVAQTLKNNRDLRVAILNVERARAQFRIQRADRLPSIGGEAMLERVGGNAPQRELYTVGIGVAAFELDLFGRVRNLSDAALQQYLATEEARRGTQLSLIAEVVGVWLGLASDQDQLRLAESALNTYERTLDLTVQRHALGATSALDVEQVRTQVEGTRSEVARLQGRVRLDRNALDLLAGAPVAAELLPGDAPAAVIGITALPAGLPAETLLRRPDVIAAEHRLLAASANIGAARAAFFPSISLTGSIGSASDELSGLFDSGTRTWSFIPRINLPIFQGGRLRAGLDAATAERDIALAQYEQAIQTGFREVADALALADAQARQVRAQEALVEAAARAESLARARYASGLDSSLVRLDAQRTLYSAQQELVATRIAEQRNRVTLYKVLGGGWQERSISATTGAGP